MSRLSSEAAVAKIGNRYDLILVASRRARELGRGDRPKTDPGPSHISTALREIEAGAVDSSWLYKPQDLSTTSHHRRYQ